MRAIQGYFSITVNANIKESTGFDNVNDNMSVFMSHLMNSNQQLKDIHTSKGFKHYSYSTPFLVSEKFRGECKFEIRTFSKDIAMSFISALMGYENDWIRVIDASIREYSFGGRITAIESITPAVATLHHRVMEEYDIEQTHRCTYWTSSMPLEVLEQSVIANLSYKYEHLTGKVIQADNAVKSIDILNNMPIAIKYNSKSATMLGNKLKIEFNNGREAQILARMAMVEGLLEKCSLLGLGYVKPTYEKVVGQ